MTKKRIIRNFCFCNISIQRFFTLLECDWRIILLHKRSNTLSSRDRIVNYCFVERVEISVLISLIRYEPFFLFSILDFSMKRECLSASRIPKWFVLIIEIYPRLRYRATFALVCRNTILRRSVSYCSFKFSRWYNGVMWYTPFLFWQLTLSL